MLRNGGDSAGTDRDDPDNGAMDFVNEATVESLEEVLGAGLVVEEEDVDDPATFPDDSAVFSSAVPRPLARVRAFVFSSMAFVVFSTPVSLR